MASTTRRSLLKMSAIAGFVFVLGFSALPVRSYASEHTATDGGNTFYPAAVWYSGGRARAPMLEKINATSARRWGADLDAIKADGFNTVKTWIDWQTGEPSQGQFDFDNLNLLMRLAQQRGLRVIVQVYLDSAPSWIGRLYPSGRFVSSSGAVIDSQSAPGYNLDDLGVHKEAVAFLEALSNDANQFPALYGWDVWSEPHIINWADFPYLKNPEFGFNPATQARFRKWLQAKYKTLKDLNAAWYRTFTSWDQVEAPRFPTILSYTDYLDWRMFIDVKLADDLAIRTRAIRTFDKVHPIASHSDAPSLFTSPTDGYGEPDDFRMSASADFYGTSMYPMHSQSIHPWSSGMLDTALDFSRSAGHSQNKGFWIGELQAGQGATAMRIAAPVTAEDETFWIWQAVAHGAREFAVYAWYPMSSGFESNGYGLINLDGTLTDRARTAGKAAANIARHAPSLLNATPAPAQIAILYNRLSYMVGGSQSSLSKLGRAPIDSAMGLHLAFAREQIPVDFVSTQEVAAGKLGQYRILFVPFPVMLSANVAEGIRRYVKNGGTVVAEARLAWNDERGFASPIIPGMGLDEVFGAREKLIAPADKPEITVGPSTDLPGWKSAAKIPGAAYEEHLEPYAGARVLGRFADGDAAIVENTFGKGRTILVGTFLALGYEQHPEAATQHFLVSLVESAGVSPEVEISGAGAGNIEVRRLVSGSEQIVFAFNESNDSADAALSLDIPWTPARAVDWMDGRDVQFATQQNKVLLKKTFAPHEVWVVDLEAR
ncbi:MAG TPA: beta-galactosidase [Acidobacteriaceae bacterium]|nr:beta-galactosidase [Acidobacteriaceae bacterium]